jgi:hypothetical protein
MIIKTKQQLYGALLGQAVEYSHEGKLITAVPVIEIDRLLSVFKPDPVVKIKEVKAVETSDAPLDKDIVKKLKKLNKILDNYATKNKKSNKR